MGGRIYPRYYKGELASFRSSGGFWSECWNGGGDWNEEGLTDYTSQIALQGYSMELVRKITLLKAVFLSVLHARRQIAY